MIMKMRRKGQRMGSMVRGTVCSEMFKKKGKIILKRARKMEIRVVNIVDIKEMILDMLSQILVLEMLNLMNNRN